MSDTTTTNKPIRIFRADDSDAFNLRTITIKLTGDLDLTNATAKFGLLSFTKTWTNDEVKKGSLTLVLSADDTKSMPLGPCFGKLWLYDGTTTEGKRLTVCNTIPFEITNVVDGAPAQEFGIDVTLAVDTEINITFEIAGGGGSGESLWSLSPTKKYIYPINPNVKSVVVPALEDVEEIGAKYTLADVKNLVNTILAALKI